MLPPLRDVFTCWIAGSVLPGCEGKFNREGGLECTNWQGKIWIRLLNSENSRVEHRTTLCPGVLSGTG